MPNASYNEQERIVLRQARELRDLVESPGWKVFEEILRAQITTREKLVLAPFYNIESGESQLAGMDFQTRALAQETLKGAVIGLRLALTTPHATIAQGKAVIEDHSNSPNGDE